MQITSFSSYVYCMSPDTRCIRAKTNYYYLFHYFIGISDLVYELNNLLVMIFCKYVLQAWMWLPNKFTSECHNAALKATKFAYAPHFKFRSLWFCWWQFSSGFRIYAIIQNNNIYSVPNTRKPIPNNRVVCVYKFKMAHCGLPNMPNIFSKFKYHERDSPFSTKTKHIFTVTSESIWCELVLVLNEVRRHN